MIIDHIFVVVSILFFLFIASAIGASFYTISLIRKNNYDNFIKRHPKIVKKLHLPR